MATRLHPRLVGGTLSPLTCHRYGCEHEEHRRAANRAQERTRARRAATGETLRRPALATRRRLLALAYVGYSQRRLAQEIGTTQRTVNRIVSGVTPMVYEVTERVVAEVYARLGEPPYPPRTGSSVRAHNYALRYRDAAPPAAWDDDTIHLPEARPMGVPDRNSA